MDECKPLLHGHTAAGDQGCGHGGLPSRAVQVDPIKPNLKPPGTKRLKLKYDTLLSNSTCAATPWRAPPSRRRLPARAPGKGTAPSPRLDLACFQRLKLKCDEARSSFAFNCNLRRYNEVIFQDRRS